MEHRVPPDGEDAALKTLPFESMFTDPGKDARAALS